MKYIVKEGDSLSIIARDILGNIELWRGIAFRNNIQSPFVIEVGQELDLPDPPSSRGAGTPEDPRRFESGLTITAPVPLDPKNIRMLSTEKILLWFGVAALAGMFFFPPKPGNMFGLSKIVGRRSSARRRRIRDQAA